MRATSTLLLLALAACVDRTIGEVPPVPDTVELKVLPVSLNRELDLLFVIDNSGSMALEHDQLQTRFPELISHLDTFIGTLPDLHIGVVSSDMGVGSIELDDARCGNDGGDGGRLQGSACPQLAGASFLSDVLGPDGDRVRSYSGTLGDAFSCAADLGIDGCGFEQHLAAMKAALSPGVNPGFLREHAQLAVIILADEDDCSADDDRIFSPDNDPVLGAFSDFRCFEFGVVCDGDVDPRAPGPRTNCRPRPDSPYLVEVEQYAAFLRGLKNRPDQQLFVAAIVGDPDNVQVITAGGRPALAVGCSGTLGDAAPAVRIAGFLDQFPAQRAQETICTADLAAALRAIGDGIGEHGGGACFTNDPVDRNPTVDGLQPECSVTERLASGEERPLPQCGAGVARPCWTVRADPGCTQTEHQLRIDVERDAPGAAGAYLHVQCVVTNPVPPPPG